MRLPTSATLVCRLLRPRTQIAALSTTAPLRLAPTISVDASNSRFTPKGTRNRGKRVESVSPTFLSGNGKGKGKSKERVRERDSNQQPPPGPRHDETWIRQQYVSETEPASNYLTAPQAELEKWAQLHEYVVLKQIKNYGKTLRCTLTVHTPTADIVGVGDSGSKKQGERLAALSIIYQTHASGELYAPVLGASKTRLDDGTIISIDQADAFLTFYCRQFKFGAPEESVIYNGPSNSWIGTMAIAGHKVGHGMHVAKKWAPIRCKLDAVRYLVKADPSLWQTFMDKISSGSLYGDSPPIPLFVPHPVRGAIQDLSADLQKSSIYNAFAPRTVAPPSSTVFNQSHETNPESLARKSDVLASRRKKYLEDPETQKMRSIRSALPVYTRTQDVLSMIEENDVSIFMAATGSGKTTQIPQIILDHAIESGKGAHCNVMCTQPRRLAAVGVATRVAAERHEAVGQSVGYSVRYDTTKAQPDGTITFCTIGVLLARLQHAFEGRGDGELDRLTHILVDEVHERDVDTDLLLVVLKRYLATRRANGNPLKVVLMSATIDGSLFQNYFPDVNGRPAPILEIPGRSFPVEKNFTDDFVQRIEQSQDSWALNEPGVRKYLANEDAYNSTAASNLPEEGDIPYPLIAATISRVIQESNEGHVLVFLPGWEEITAVERLLTTRRWASNLADPKFEIHSLHSSVPLKQQQAVFEPPVPGIRRIILTTNIAETSVTIPDVVYVVDCGRLKEVRYDPERNLTSLVTAWVGRSNLNQRAGRAGRHRNGFYYGIMSRAHADSLSTYQTVEMARTDLTNVIMHVKSLNFKEMSIKQVLQATIEPPEDTRINLAVRGLQRLGALDENEDLTTLGRILNKLPLDIHLSRVIIYGCFLSCLDQAASLAAILSSRDPWYSPSGAKSEALAAKKKWIPAGSSSDTLTTLRAFTAWKVMEDAGDRAAAKHFLHANFLNGSTFTMIDRTRKQLLGTLKNAGLVNIRRDNIIPEELRRNSKSEEVLSALLCVAMQPNFGVPTGRRFLRTREDLATLVHMSSINTSIGDNAQPLRSGELMVYAEKRNQVSGVTSQTFLSNTAWVKPLVYVLFGATKHEVAEGLLRCDDWLLFKCPSQPTELLRLRADIDRCLLRFYAATIATQEQQRRVASSPRVGGIFDREGETEDDVETRELTPLSTQERTEMDYLATDIAAILENYAAERQKFYNRYEQEERYQRDVGRSQSIDRGRRVASGGLFQ
ncbi:P-loop containing nucleoside triphosphate hydrolase protein [Cylindrobasidium torrendii FP15055 ss-10]|uniref:p-loop containing nucleoside triphosphate hydrolase protein n=1 Tax=Cylindrobasidium torrendii FP15055 ss-10 TaxID=1314674 RepID=A0A0D7BMB9_9AGAR|nr:P-loop containing nucleoside triphosphate hydrolase protein [Cylindrobasidium torrendii FP15055 ss-10]